MTNRTESTAPSKRASRSWIVLVVDDDDSVHEATAFALRGCRILGRPVELVRASSAAEALAIARSTPGIAVALVDVVMETPDAGLKLVRDMRADGLSDMRIVLRTGYPGYAPELSVIEEYEIDDYRTKDELTRTRLLTVLTASIRAHAQIRAISRSRAGLEMIVNSADMLFRRTNLELFSQGVLTQIAALMRVPAHGLVCASSTEGGMAVVSAVGRFAHLLGRPAAEIDDPVVAALLGDARADGLPVERDGFTALHFRAGDRRALSVVLESHDGLEVPDTGLLKIFSMNIATGFENLALVEALDRLAYVDPIIETPNLNAFESKLRQRLATGQPNGRLGLTNIDSFQSLVAAFGQPLVHDLLRSIYARLQAHRDAGVVVARVGDGTFGLIGEKSTLGEASVPAAFAEPHRIDGVEIAATSTTVIVDLDDMPADVTAILKSGFAALLHTKRTRRSESVLYDAATRAGVERQGMLREALRRAVPLGNGLAVHLQPKVDLGSGATVGAEALLRWNLDDTPVSPGEFIPIAESAGLTRDLTGFVIREVGRWNRRPGADPMPVAVNLSTADLGVRGFATDLMRLVEASGLSPATLEFEVTEGLAMQDARLALAQTSALKEAGYRIAIDDFGTGYSSLGRFDRLPIDTIKIDRSFVNMLTIASARHSLAAIVVSMTAALNVDCVAEGIETDEQKQALMFLGCRLGQGFLLGRPTPIDEFAGRFLAPTAPAAADRDTPAS